MDGIARGTWVNNHAKKAILRRRPVLSASSDTVKVGITPHRATARSVLAVSTLLSMRPPKSRTADLHPHEVVVNVSA